MSDDALPSTDQFRGTVGYERKVNLGDYNSETVSVFIQFEVTPNDEAETVAAANDAVFQAKTVAFSQLGLASQYVDGVLTALVSTVFPGTVANPGIGGGVPEGATRPTAAPSAPAASGEPSCPVCSSPLWDNRPKNAERLAAGQKALPEGRCKQYADAPKGTGCKGIVWKWAA